MIKRDKRRIKNCFWIFLFLLITEGIFRRWLFPSLNNVFLVARDPFVIYAIFLGIKAGLLRDTPAILMLFLSILCFFSALFFGHGNIIVALYGMRILLYFPYIFITARVLSRDDVLKIGRIFVMLIVPMTLLCMVQFVSPQSSFVNIGVAGSEEGAGFGGAMGYFRPPGIFTFIAALTDYYAISLSFLLYFILNEKDALKVHLSKNVLYAAVFFYIISIPVSISRTHLVLSIFILCFYLIAVANNTKQLPKLILGSVLIIVSILVAELFVPDIDLYTTVFSERFKGANSAEGGLAASAYERTFGWAMRAFDKAPIMGYGDGYFTNVGMTILHGDVSDYTGELAKIEDSTEMEWGRVICEDGLILGSCILLLRFYITINIFIKARKAFLRLGDMLPWLLLPFSMHQILICPLKAPYHLGFLSVIAIACLSVLRQDLMLYKYRKIKHNYGY